MKASRRIAAITIIAAMLAGPVLPATITLTFAGSDQVLEQVGVGGTSPRAGAGGDLVRNPTFVDPWTDDWVGSVESQTVTKQRQVNAYAVHRSWGLFTCTDHVDESFSSTSTARDDGGASYSTDVELAKTSDDHLRWTATLFSSGYAKATAGSSTWPCESEASVSWSFNDLSVYNVRITQVLNEYPGALSLDYAVLSGKYKMTTTMVEAEDWHAEVTWSLKAPDGSTYQVRTEFFSSEQMHGVERVFNEDVRSIFVTEGAGTYTLYVDFTFRIGHQDARSDSATGSGATAQTPSITYDDQVAVEIYDVSLPWAQGLYPPLVHPITPNPDIDGEVTVTWDEVADADAYQVFREDHYVDDISETSGPIAQVTTTSYTDSGLAPGTYFYAVQAIKSGQSPSGLSACESVTVILPPAAPVLSAISPNPDDDGVVTLTWSASQYAEAYEVYQSTTPISSSADLAGKDPLVVTTNTTAQLPFLPDGTYHFAVVATNPAGTSDPSNDESVVVDVLYPPAEPVLEEFATDEGKDGRVTLNWNAVTGAVAYKVYRASHVIVDPADPDLLIGITELTTFTDYGVEDETTYYYAVAATNYKYDSKVSNTKFLYVDVPNVIDAVKDWVTNLDPFTRGLVFGAINKVLGQTGADLEAFLTGQSGSWSTEFTVDVGQWDDIGGAMGVSLEVDLSVALTLTDNAVDVVLVPQATVDLDVQKMALAGAFGDASGVISQLSNYGVSVTATVDVAGKVDFTIDLTPNQESVSVNELALQVTPKVVGTCNVLKAVLAAVAPEVEPVISQVVSLVDKLTGYNVYGILTSQVTVVVDFVARYYPGADKFVADALLEVTFDAIKLNFIQKDDGDVDEMVVGLYGTAGVHYDSTTKAFDTCGGIDFYVDVDLSNAGPFFGNLLEKLAGAVGLSTSERNVWHLLGDATGCDPVVPVTAGPAAAATLVDADGDYLPASVDPDDTQPDADHDGLWDFLEVVVDTSPTGGADSDDDGLLDLVEFYGGTDPTDDDSDGDGYPDALELNFYGTNPDNPDTDGDGLSDSEEVDSRGTDPLLADTDGDGVKDGWEALWYGSDPRVDASTPADTDEDGLYDKDETELFGTDPLVHEGLDVDDDGLLTYQETILYVGLDPTDPDTDDDGALDGAEVLAGTYYLDPDTDDDRLLDGEEMNTYGTDPKLSDTDGDGYSDYLEVKYGSDPLDPSSLPDLGLADAWAWVWVLAVGGVVGLAGAAGYFVYKRARDPLRGVGVPRWRLKFVGLGTKIRGSLSSLADRLRGRGADSELRALEKAVKERKKRR
ncbi:MAG: hypothetical protein Kow0069_02880 [Promethearchaeota archaeon]